MDLRQAAQVVVHIGQWRAEFGRHAGLSAQHIILIGQTVAVPGPVSAGELRVGIVAESPAADTIVHAGQATGRVITVAHARGAVAIADPAQIAVGIVTVADGRSSGVGELLDLTGPVELPLYGIAVGVGFVCQGDCSGRRQSSWSGSPGP